MSMNVLVLDDEIEIADLVEVYLKSENFNVFKCYDSRHAIDILNTKKIDLAILDVMVDEVSGFDIVELIRKKSLKFPIIMLTAKIANQDKIQGLTIGADDYITKPFNPLELIARVKAVMRRYTEYNASTIEDQIYINGLTISKSNHECELYGRKVDLTPLEFDIVWYLATNRGRVVSSEELFESVWKDKYFDSNNTVMVHIRRIRDKLGDSSKEPKFIKTVWGVGYKIENAEI
ncbi:MAG: response regulator transcription factor [Bacilli bacterium]|nr:response regulator transcription factor [Bacilli bacterium]